MTPIMADVLAAELSEHMQRITVLDLHPVENGFMLDHHVARAREIVDALHTYLHTSDNVAPVIESVDAVQEWEL